MKWSVLAAAVLVSARSAGPVDPRLDDAAAQALSEVAEDRRCPVQREW